MNNILKKPGLKVLAIVAVGVLALAFVVQAASKGNNGLGNGEDPAPPGNPRPNDEHNTSPGNPGSKPAQSESNNGVGNGEDPAPPGNPPLNDGHESEPGNPNNSGGSN